MSSRVSVARQAALEDPCDQAGLAGAVAVVDGERGQVDRRIGQAVHRLRPRRHDLRVGHVLGVEAEQLVVGATLVGRKAVRRRVAAQDGRVSISAGAVPGMFEWMPISSGGRLNAHRTG